MMYLSLSGTTPSAVRALAFAGGLSDKTIRSASNKCLQILMTKEPPVAIGCQTEQTTLGTSCVDDGCQTESSGQVNTECQTEVSLLLPGSEYAQILAYDIIMPRIKDTSNGIFSLLSKDLREQQFSKLPKPRPSQGDRSGPINRIAKQLIAVNAVLCMNPEEELKVVERVVSNYDKISLGKSDDKISVDLGGSMNAN
jgi:hypothetical protein